MLLGIGLHASLGFLPISWYVQDSSATWDGPFDEFLWAVHGFRMPVFFLLSGFFTAMLWRRRGLRALLNHRLRRVLLPLVIGLVTIVPLINWVGEWAYVSAVDSEETSDIFGAAYAGDVSRVEEFLDRGGDFHVEMRAEPGGWTLLHVAAFTGNAEMTAMLLSRGADPAPTAPASEGETPLGVAFYFGQERVAGALVAAGGGKGPPSGVEWSELPGWGEGVKYDGEAESLSAWPEMHHLWFLWTLLWLVAGFAVVAWLVDGAERDSGASPGEGAWPRRIMWMMLPLSLLPQLRMAGGGAFPAFGPDTPGGLLPFPHVLVYYAAFFTFGALMYGRSGRKGHPVIDTVGRRWWLILPTTALVVFPAGLIVTFVEEARSWPAASVLQVLYAWGMCLGLMGLFRVLIPREHRGIRYLSDSSYWLYVAHLPLVVVAQAIVRDWNLAPVLKFLMICVVVTALLLLSYQLFVRYTPIGTMLNGRRARPTSRGDGPSGPGPSR